jgi:hypothetical protein
VTSVGLAKDLEVADNLIRLGKAVLDELGFYAEGLEDSILGRLCNRINATVRVPMAPAEAGLLSRASHIAAARVQPLPTGSAYFQKYSSTAFQGNSFICDLPVKLSHNYLTRRPRANLPP